jgi:hypothetical protein
MTLTEVLLARRWVQHELGSDGDNTACLMGGLVVAVYGSLANYFEPTRSARNDVQFISHWDRLGRIAGRLFPERCGGGQDPRAAIDVNNHPSTTFADVLKIAAEHDREVEAGV